MLCVANRNVSPGKYRKAAHDGTAVVSSRTSERSLTAKSAEGKTTASQDLNKTPTI